MNPVYELLVEALDCADRLALAGGAALLHDAMARAGEVVELPAWLPQFIALVKAMRATKAIRNGVAGVTPHEQTFCRDD